MTSTPTKCLTILVLLSCLLFSSPITGQPLKGDHTYVRGFTPKEVALKNGVKVKGLTIQFIDDDLPGILAAPKYSVVDVVMQECFAGAFVDALKAADKAGNPIADDWTACSASGATQPSWGSCGIIPPKTAGVCDDFTRAWREDALVNDANKNPPNTGMKQHFDTAVGNPGATAGIAADRFSLGRAAVHFMVVPTTIVTGWNWKWVPTPFGPMKQWTPTLGVVPVSYYVVQGNFGGVDGWWAFIFPNGWQQVTPTPDPPPKAGGRNVWKLGPPPGAGAAFDDAVQVPQASERSQYGSKGAGSDARTLAVPNDVQQYAILVQWDEPKYPGKLTAHFAGSISRMYSMLRDTYSVPKGNIAILYYDGSYADPVQNSLPALDLSPAPASPPAPAPPKKVEKLPAVSPIDAPTGLDANGKQQFADKAMKGDYFTGGVADFSKSRLLVYFTGHGGRSQVNKTKVGYTTDPNFVVQLLPGTTVDTNGNVTVTGFDAVGEFEQALTSFLANTNDDDFSYESILYNTNNVLDDFQSPMAQFQISTTQLIPSNVRLVINGYTNPYPLQPITDTNETVFDLDQFVPGLLTNTYTYHLLVDNFYLYNFVTGHGPAEIDLQFQELAVTNFDPNFVAAVVVRGALQEVAYIVQDSTAATNLTAQDLGGGLLLTWPSDATNYNLLANYDLSTTNWVAITNQTTLTPELTGVPDPSLPMGANWAFFDYEGSQRFFRLRRVSP